ncbi:MAG: ABC transporter substrate-binding protein [Spirochaetaceae bacterium]|nr:MAG: ABC transporter substrate-binding protein [Spirochaetaceae bacterium]
MRKRILLSVFLVLILSASLVFAGGAKEAPRVIDDAAQPGEVTFPGVMPIDHSQGWERGTRGGTFVMSSLSDPRTFSTVVAAETSTTDITSRLYSYAMRRNQHTLEWEPHLAESYTISDDQKTVTYTLRPNLRWSDGQPLTSSDFVDAVNEIYYNTDVQTNQRSGLFVGGEPSVWEVIDDRRFRITLPSVYAGIHTLSSRTPLPMHIFGPVLEEGGAAAVNSFWGVDTDVTQVVGNGPFKIAEYVPSQRVRLIPNPHYYERDEWGTQLPYLDELIFQIIPDQDAQLQRFLGGGLDFYGLRGEDYAVLVDRKDDIGFEMFSVGPAASSQFITFNQNPNGIDPPKLTWLSNKTFRQAMAHLVDRQTIIDNIAFGFGYPQFSFVPTFSPYYWQEAPNAAFPYDPGTAAEMLDSIGYIDRNGDGWRQDPDGNKISLVLETNAGNTTRESIAQLFAQEAQAIGVEVINRAIDFNVLVGKLTSTFDWDMILIGLTGSVDPITGSNVYPSSGNLHMIEPSQESPRREWEAEVDRLWDYANLTTDEDQRVRGFRGIQEIWIEEVPWVFTFNPAVMHAYKTEWGNIYPHPVDGLSWDGIISRVYRRN